MRWIRHGKTEAGTPFAESKFAGDTAGLLHVTRFDGEDRLAFEIVTNRGEEGMFLSREEIADMYRMLGDWLED